MKPDYIDAKIVNEATGNLGSIIAQQAVMIADLNLANQKLIEENKALKAGDKYAKYE